RVLDVGCGPGVDLELFASETGVAYGIDRSTTMAAAAAARADGSVVAVADARHLPLPTRSFDGVWSRALLIHVPEPGEAVAEFARVAKPNRRIGMFEGDQGSHVVATPHVDIFERVKAHRRTRFRNPNIGRRLPQLAVDAGLRVEVTRVVPITYTSL